jgi:imidazolonepropionase-like amidohydrolase
MAKLRTFIEDTRYYAGHRAEFDRGQTRSLSAGRADLDAMIPVVQGRVPLLVEADKSSDILAAIALGREYGLKVVIAGGAEAWMVAHELAAARVPVLAGAMMNIPYAFTALGSRQDNVALLRKAGVEVALVGNAGGGDEELFNVRNIRFEAGNAVGYGMSRDDALRAVTLGPALIFGVADRVGSLSAGREANVVVWDGDPFEFASHAEVVFVRGRRYQDHSRQDQLTDRYKTLPPAYQKP